MVCSAVHVFPVVVVNGFVYLVSIAGLDRESPCTTTRIGEGHFVQMVDRSNSNHCLYSSIDWVIDSMLY